MDIAALRFDGIAKSYGGTPVLRGVDLAIPAGQFVALVGESGSGKTTLLKSVNRLVPPDAGHVLIGGEDAAALAVHLLRRRIGYVFQGTGLFPHMSVADNIALPLRLADVPVAERMRRVVQLLNLVGLDTALAKRLPDALSGGQSQRVGVARALAASPSLMLMDEPFGALDPVTRDALGRAYRDLHDRLGLTTVMVTHDMAEALLLADRVVMLREGTIAADGAPRELLAGTGNAAIDALLAVPLEQARRLAALS